MSTQPPAILVVDDEAQVRQVVRSVLEADGYELTTPFSAVDLLDAVRELLADA